MVKTSAPQRVYAPAKSHSAAETSLLQRFDAAPTQLPETLSELRVAAIAYGSDLRKNGLSPEQLVIALKTLLCCHGGFTSLPSVLEEQRYHDAPVGSAKYERILDWCLQGYFEETPSGQ